MAKYCVNKNRDAQQDYEVHNLETCVRLPLLENRVALGDHSTCLGAVAKAKALGYTTANGCYYCSKACHTS